MQLSILASLVLLASSAQALTLQIDLQNQTFDWIEGNEIHFNVDDHPSTIFGSYTPNFVTIDAPLPISSGALSELSTFNIGTNEAGTEIVLVWFQGTTVEGPATLSGTPDDPATPVFLFEGQGFSFFDNLLPGSYALPSSPESWSNSLTVEVIPEPSTVALIAGTGVLLLALLRRVFR